MTESDVFSKSFVAMVSTIAGISLTSTYARMERRFLSRHQTRQLSFIILEVNLDFSDN